jgi:hypothetical protein
MAVISDATLDKPGYGPTLAPKDEVRALLDRLPDKATLEDIRYHLDVVIKVYEAEAGIAAGGSIDQAEFDRKFAKWLTP